MMMGKSGDVLCFVGLNQQSVDGASRIHCGTWTNEPGNYNHEHYGPHYLLRKIIRKSSTAHLGISCGISTTSIWYWGIQPDPHIKVNLPNNSRLKFALVRFRCRWWIENMNTVQNLRWLMMIMDYYTTWYLGDCENPYYIFQWFTNLNLGHKRGW